jgi:hypothetical protein
VTSPGGDVTVATALARALSRFGWSLASDGRRVEACLKDELGADVRAHRLAVEAVVAAAEQSIPLHMRDPAAFDRAAAVRQLAARGISEPLASFAVDSWAWGLGVGTLPRPEPVEPPSTSPSTLPTPAPTPLPVVRGPRRWYLLAAGALTAIGIVVALIVTLGGNDPPSSPTPASLTFDVEQLDWGPGMTRVWTATSRGVRGELTFVNSSDERVSGTYVEAIPKSLAADASHVVTAAEHQVLADDPVFEFSVEVEAASTRTVTYVITTSLPATPDRLRAWRSDLVDARADYQDTTD